MAVSVGSIVAVVQEALCTPIVAGTAVDADSTSAMVVEIARSTVPVRQMAMKTVGLRIAVDVSAEVGREGSGMIENRSLPPLPEESCAEDNSTQTWRICRQGIRIVSESASSAGVSW